MVEKQWSIHKEKKETWNEMCITFREGKKQREQGIYA